MFLAFITAILIDGSTITNSVDGVSFQTERQCQEYLYKRGYTNTGRLSFFCKNIKRVK